MDINIKRQFDQTDPFAQANVAAMQIRHWQDRVRPTRKDIPPEVWDRLADQVIAQQRTARTPQYEQPVHLSTVEVPAWDGEREMSSSLPTVIYRPRRVARHVTWQWRLIVIGIRLGRRLQRVARKQLRQSLKASRRFLRRVLPRPKAMRGGREPADPLPTDHEMRLPPRLPVTTQRCAGLPPCKEMK